MAEYKILWASDLHKKMTDISTIRGYTKVNRDVQLSLMKLIEEKECTHFISGGDWYDSGYGSDIAAGFSHEDIDREMAIQLKGNFYGLIGNHIRINMDSNPELFLIQPHPTLTTRHKVTRDYQIIKTPETLMLNRVQISFMHYNRDAKSAEDYISNRMEHAKYHIGLYHTPYVIPTNYLHGIGMNKSVNENSKIAAAMAGVDLAIVGDIHKPLGQFNINKSDGTTTTMIVPGSLTNTNAGSVSMHNSVDLPLITIKEDGSVTVELIEFDILVNRLTFITPTAREEARAERLDSIRGNNVPTLYDETTSRLIGNSDVTFKSLNAYMAAQGYTATDKDMMKIIIDNPEDVDSLVKMYKENVLYESDSILQ